MKKRLVSYLSLLLGGVMLLGMVASCKDQVPDESQEQNTTLESSELPSTQGTTEVPPVVMPPVALTGQHALLISGAYDRANGVQTYYASSSRDQYVVENQNMTLLYQLGGTTGKMVKSLSNKQGAAYLQDTMDAYVKTTDGGT